MQENPEERLQRLQEDYNNFKALVETRGWKRLLEIADQQIKNRAGSAYGKLENILEWPAKEFERGEISGIMLFQVLPETYLGELVEDIDRAEKELEYATGERTTDTDPDGNAEPGEFEPPV